MWKCFDYTNDYFGPMIKMIRDNYGNEQSISHSDYLEHWYFSNPSGNPIIKLAIDEESNTMAGQYVICPRKYMICGEEVKCVLSLDTLTRDTYRGQGIFTSLANYAFDEAQKNGFKFCYGAPNQNSHHGFVKKLGFTDLCEMPLFVRPLKISKMVSEKISKFIGTLCCPLNLFFGAKKIKDLNISKVTNDNYLLMDCFWELILKKYEIIGIRDSDYIKFRYLNVPTREYYPFFYMKEGRPVAFIVARIREVAGITTGMIADFLFVQGYEKQAAILVKYICRLIRDMGANLAGCIMLKNVDEVKILKKAHFFRCPKKILPHPTPLIVRPFDEKLLDKGFLDLNKWFFTTGDYDVV